MRQSEGLRRLFCETRLSLDQFIMPYFVCEGSRIKDPIDSMPDQYRFSGDALLAELEELIEAGVGAILLFGIPAEKDSKASSAWSAEGIIQKSVRGIKKNFPDLVVITDVCLCAYTDHGHCGILNSSGQAENDSTLEVLSRIALSHAEAGSDMAAPSDMMDGRVEKIRNVLDQNGFQNAAILSYAVKYASAFYGPFRDAAHSAPASGDRKTYQMDPANAAEALREIAQDIQEGADMIIVKPALAYLDIIREATQVFRFPLAAYSVSGEYSMIKAAAQKGWIDEKNVVLEIMTALARSGARALITYHAKQLAQWKILDQQLFQPAAGK